MSNTYDDGIDDGIDIDSLDDAQLDQLADRLAARQQERESEREFGDLYKIRNDGAVPPTHHPDGTRREDPNAPVRPMYEVMEARMAAGATREAAMGDAISERLKLAAKGDRRVLLESDGTWPSR